MKDAVSPNTHRPPLSNGDCKIHPAIGTFCLHNLAAKSTVGPVLKMRDLFWDKENE